MKTLLTFIFSFSLLFAGTVKPAKMYDHQNLIRNMFLPLKQYITKIKALYPYDADSKSLHFYTQDPYFAHFNIYLYKLVDGYELNILSENSENFKILLILENEVELTLDQFINGDFLNVLNNQSYKLKILPRGFTLESNLFSDKRVTQYIYSLDATTMNLHEYFSKNRYESNLFYKCARCGGEILRAIFDENEENYFVGMDQKRVNDREFFNQANRWYLSPLLGIFAGTISAREDSHQWPESE